MNETETCQNLITPALVAAGWDLQTQVLRERRFTDGRLHVVGNRATRGKAKKADYVLRYDRALRLAIVEAKAKDEPVDKGFQQAKEYAELLGLKFAFATNGVEIREHDFYTGLDSVIARFPTPDELLARWRKGEGLTQEAENVVRTPFYHDPKRAPRYYQEVAVDRAVAAFASGRDKALLTLATGTGKSFVAFQVCWRLREARWTRSGRFGRPKILFLADRDVLVDDPMNREFAPFESAMIRVTLDENGSVPKARDIYFATYQAIAEDVRRPGAYKQYAPDFFDLIIIDECHRGSASESSTWREILDYFTGAAKLGLTATPLKEESRDTYEYFGRPLLWYSLRRGIEDGFLAPYKVRRVVTSIDASGYRAEAGKRDQRGNVIPDRQFGTSDFERSLVIHERTKAVAKYLTDYLKATDRFAKTLVFCVDQEHAATMRRELNNLNADLVKQHPDYVCRVTADEGAVGRTHLSNFQDVERKSPVILTTSEMLTTGVDAPTVRNVVIVRIVNSMSTFKQIIGRGTRLRVDYGKEWFSILDFTGSATKLFADKDFDGEPEFEEDTDIDQPPSGDDEAEAEDEEDGQDGGGGSSESDEEGDSPPDDSDPEGEGDSDSGEHGDADDGGDGPEPPPRKFYVGGVPVTIANSTVQILDPDGKLRTVEYTQYVGDSVRTLFRSPHEFRERWVVPSYRQEALQALAERGIDVRELAEKSGHGDADAFDLLCHIAFSAPVRTRQARAEALRGRSTFWATYPAKAREILTAILDKYATHGATQIAMPGIIEAPPVSDFGNIMEIVSAFGGRQQLIDALAALQRELYNDAAA